MSEFQLDYSGRIYENKQECESVTEIGNNYYILGKLFPSVQIGTGSLLFCYCKGGIRASQDSGGKRSNRGVGMANMHVEKRPQWLRIEPGGHDEIDDFSQKMGGQIAEDRGVLIGQWYYYLFSYGTSIDLCRTRGTMGQPSLTEVLKPGELGISDDDLEGAVHYETYGFTERGQYRISPLIERKLRILFE